MDYRLKNKQKICWVPFLINCQRVKWVELFILKYLNDWGTTPKKYFVGIGSCSCKWYMLEFWRLLIKDMPLLLFRSDTQLYYSVSSWCDGLSDQSLMVNSLSYFLFQPELYDWCNIGHGKYYPVCGIVHTKDSMLLTKNSSLYSGNNVTSFVIWMVLSSFVWHNMTINKMYWWHR